MYSPLICWCSSKFYYETISIMLPKRNASKKYLHGSWKLHAHDSQENHVKVKAAKVSFMNLHTGKKYYKNFVIKRLSIETCVAVQWKIVQSHDDEI